VPLIDLSFHTSTACWCLCIWNGSSRAQLVQMHKDWLSTADCRQMDLCWQICWFTLCAWFFCHLLLLFCLWRFLLTVCRCGSTGLLNRPWIYPASHNPSTWNTWSPHAKRVKYLCFAPALKAATGKLDEYYEKTTDSSAYIIMSMSKLLLFVTDATNVWWNIVLDPTGRCLISKRTGHCICKKMF